MTILFALACATEAPSLTESPLSTSSAPVFQAELSDYDVDTDGPLVAEIVEEIPGDSPIFSGPLAVTEIDEGGYFVTELPVAPDGAASARYRVVIRQEMEGGTGGAIRSVWPTVVVWNDVAISGGPPAGWAFERTSHGIASYTAVSLVSLSLPLRPVGELTVEGGLAADPFAQVDTSDFAVALMAGDEVVPGVVGVVAEGGFVVRLDGPVAAGSATLQPVAYRESDGFLGFDPGAEELVGLACARGAEAFVRFADEPFDVGVALQMEVQHKTVGWSSIATFSGRERTIVGMPLRLDDACR